MCPCVCVFKIISRNSVVFKYSFKKFLIAFLVACWNDQSLPHFIYPPPLQQDKWMTPSQLYIQTHNLRMVFRHVGKYLAKENLENWWKLENVHLPPSPLPLRHSFATCRHQTCFSPWILWIMRLTLWANSKYLPGQNFEKFDQNIGKCRYGSNMCCTGRGLGNVKTFSIFQQQTKKCGGPV